MPPLWLRPLRPYRGLGWHLRPGVSSLPSLSCNTGPQRGRRGTVTSVTRKQIEGWAALVIMTFLIGYSIWSEILGN